MDLTTIKAGDVIRYIKVENDEQFMVTSAEDTYENQEDVPDEEKGKLFVAVLLPNGKPAFVDVQKLNPNEWDIVDEWSEATDENYVD